MCELTEKQIRRSSVVKGSVDRITEGGMVILLLESGDEITPWETEATMLPVNVQEGDYVTVWIIGRWVKKVEKDSERTEREKQNSVKLREEVRNQNKGSRFKRKE